MAASRMYGPEEEFILRLRQRMPMGIGFSFTSEQLEALRGAFGDRFSGRHTVDMRGRLHLPWSSYYLVFQAGRDRREDVRRNAGIRLARTVIDSVACGLTVCGLAAGAVLLVTRLLA